MRASTRPIIPSSRSRIAFGVAASVREQRRALDVEDLDDQPLVGDAGADVLEQRIGLDRVAAGAHQLALDVPQRVVGRLRVGVVLGQRVALAAGLVARQHVPG